MKQLPLTGMPQEQTPSQDTPRERCILLGLAHEWELACLYLEENLRRRLPKPSFRLADMRARLGQWSPARREICLSRDLAESHPWDEVREVLRHEMAHQLADTLLGASGQPPHGPAFQQACLMLRADPAAAAARRPLRERIHSQGAEEGGIRRRIRKLLSLAQSTNLHEAEAAMLKAHALMTRHHLDALQLEEQRFVSLFLGQPALRHFREAYALANLLQDFYFVQGIWVSAFVLDKGKTGRVLEISGTPANVDNAAYVHDFIRGFTARRWAAYRKGRTLKRRQQTDFAVGIIEGFRSKLEKARAATTEPEILALATCADPQLSRYLRHRYPRTQSIQRGGRQDPDVYNDGCQIGRKLVIARGIGAHAGHSRRRLPPD
jgi:hypothetical protein